MRAGVRTSSVRVTELYRSATRRTSSAGMLRFQNVQGLCCTAAFAREWQNMSTVRTYSTSVPRPGHFLVAISRQLTILPLWKKNLCRRTATLRRILRTPLGHPRCWRQVLVAPKISGSQVLGGSPIRPENFSQKILNSVFSACFRDKSVQNL